MCEWMVRIIVIALVCVSTEHRGEKDPSEWSHTRVSKRKEWTYTYILHLNVVSNGGFNGVRVGVKAFDVVLFKAVKV